MEDQGEGAERRRVDEKERWGEKIFFIIGKKSLTGCLLHGKF